MPSLIAADKAERDARQPHREEKQMAYTAAETAAIAKASAHVDTAHQAFTAIQTRLRTSITTHVNNPASWATAGAQTFGNTMLGAYDQELTKILTSLDQIRQNLGTSNVHYNNGVANESASVARFVGLLGA